MSAAGPPQGAKAPSGGSEVHEVTSVGAILLAVVRMVGIHRPRAVELLDQ